MLVVLFIYFRIFIVKPRRKFETEKPKPKMLIMKAFESSVNIDILPVNVLMKGSTDRSGFTNELKQRELSIFKDGVDAGLSGDEEG